MKPIGTRQESSLMTRAYALLKKKKYREAREKFKAICKLEGSNLKALYALASINMELGDYFEAEKCCKKIIVLQPDSAAVQYNLAIAYKAQGKIDKAIVCYKRALQLNPEFLEAYSNLAMALLDFGQPDEAETYLKLAVKLDPEKPQLYYNLGIVYEGQKKIKEAVESFEQALQIRPDYADAMALLGQLFEKQHRLDESQGLADKALNLDPGHIQANILRSRLDRRSVDLESARERLTALLPKDVPCSDETDLRFELGLVLDRLGEYKKAYQHFSAAQSAAAQAASHRFKLDDISKRLRKYEDWFTNERVASWRDSASHYKLQAPVFLVGFPRSGTTLTEQILASHSQVVTLDEQPIIAQTLRKLQALVGSRLQYPDSLDLLTLQEINVLREFYWEHASEVVKFEYGEQVLVDKLPLNIVHLGFIHRIFPDAKCIIVLRDPRDSCLSCFTQQFRLNEYMAHFTTFRGTVSLYDAVMRLWLHYRSVLDITYSEFHYEDLVENLEQVAGDLLDFMGLPWEDAVLQYHSRDKQRYVSTPSYQAVASPIYKRAMGRWRNYEADLKPGLEILAPYVSAFGYSDD